MVFLSQHRLYWGHRSCIENLLFVPKCNCTNDIEWLEDLKRTGQLSLKKNNWILETNIIQTLGKVVVSNIPFETYTQVFPKMVREDPPTDLIMASWIEILSEKNSHPQTTEIGGPINCQKKVNLKVTTNQPHQLLQLPWWFFRILEF